MLTDRQRQVLTLLAHGKTQQEIAHELDKNYSYIRNVAQLARESLNARTTVEAVALAVLFGEINITEQETHK